MVKNIKHVMWEDDLICTKCKHYMHYKKCKAFPSGIPNEIYNGWIVHTEKIRIQQGDYVFERHWKKRYKKTSFE